MPPPNAPQRIHGFTRPESASADSSTFSPHPSADAHDPIDHYLRAGAFHALDLAVSQVAAHNPIPPALALHVRKGYPQIRNSKTVAGLDLAASARRQINARHNVWNLLCKQLPPDASRLILRRLTADEYKDALDRVVANPTATGIRRMISCVPSTLPAEMYSEAHAVLVQAASRITDLNRRSRVYQDLAASLPSGEADAFAAHAELRRLVSHFPSEELQCEMYRALAQHIPAGDAAEPHLDLRMFASRLQNQEIRARAYRYLAQYLPAGETGAVAHANLRVRTSRLANAKLRAHTFVFLAKHLPSEPMEAAAAHARIRERASQFADEEIRMQAMIDLATFAPPGADAKVAAHADLREHTSLIASEKRRAIAYGRLARHLPEGEAGAGAHADLRELASQISNHTQRCVAFILLTRRLPPGAAAIVAHAELRERISLLDTAELRGHGYDALKEHLPQSGTAEALADVQWRELRDVPAYLLQTSAKLLRHVPPAAIVWPSLILVRWLTYGTIAFRPGTFNRF